MGVDERGFGAIVAALDLAHKAPYGQVVYEELIPASMLMCVYIAASVRAVAVRRDALMDMHAAMQAGRTYMVNPSTQNGTESTM